MEQIVFWSLAAVTIISALGVVLLRNVIHSALMLGLCLFGVAGLFASLSADFLFAAQILIYVGGIAVLILFVVLLAGRVSDLLTRQINAQWPTAALICAMFFWGAWSYVRSFRGAISSGTTHATTAGLGKLLLGDFAVPFELISIILLVALAGAILFSKSEIEQQ